MTASLRIIGEEGGASNSSSCHVFMTESPVPGEDAAVQAAKEFQFDLERTEDGLGFREAVQWQLLEVDNFRASLVAILGAFSMHCFEFLTYSFQNWCHVVTQGVPRRLRPHHPGRHERLRQDRGGWGKERVGGARRHLLLHRVIACKELGQQGG